MFNALTPVAYLVVTSHTRTVLSLLLEATWRLGRFRWAGSHA